MAAKLKVVAWQARVVKAQVGDTCPRVNREDGVDSCGTWHRYHATEGMITVVNGSK